ncbi:MAG TPA: polysaccharide deacetylase family protein [Cellvibrionaceae bacterium]|nr:polysaccharide deacetylase family protein [Cellvibrionaceae bacterium]
MSNLADYLYTDPRIERLLTGLLGSWATIFTLHRPPSASGAYDGVTPEFLAEALSFVKTRGYQFISVDELVVRALRGDSLRRCLCFTLDDGFADQLEQLVPVLLRYDAKPTLFVITDLIDGTAWPWDNQLAHLCWHASAGLYSFELNGQRFDLDLSSPTARRTSRRQLTRVAKSLQRPAIEALLVQLQACVGLSIPAQAPVDYQPASWEQLRQAESLGLRIGCHARSHFTFNALSQEEVVAELAHSKARLAAELAQPSAIFCYPSGTQNDFAPHHEPLVQQAGFLAAVSTLSKNTCAAAIQQAPYRIQRIGMPQQLNHFVRYISWFEYLRGRMA